MRQILQTQNDPIAVLIDIANDSEVDVQVRVQAATAAAPFLFPRLSANVAAMAPGNARHDTDRLVEQLRTRFQRLAGLVVDQGAQVAPPSPQSSK